MQLADKEKLVAETPFGIGSMGGIATLTDQRVVLAARDYEESIPLRALTSVRCAFSRDAAAVAWGALLFVLAFGFAAGYKSMETAANGVGAGVGADAAADGAWRSQARCGSGWRDNPDIVHSESKRGPGALWAPPGIDGVRRRSRAPDCVVRSLSGRPEGRRCRLF